MIVTFVGVNLVAGLHVRSRIEEKLNVTTSFHTERNLTNDMEVLLHQFLLKKGYYPTTLGLLVGEGWTTPQAIARFSYRRVDEGTSYVLTPLSTEKTPIKLPF